MNKNIEYYLNLPYTLELSYDPEHAWFIRVKELPGCTSQGETPDEAVAMVKDAMRLWIEDALEEGIVVPEPRSDDDYSGKFNLRVPVSLHRKLSRVAEENKVSLNTFCVAALSEAVGLATEGKRDRQGYNQTTTSEGQIYSWPGLTMGARRVLLAAGVADEAGRIDEQLFADWANKQIANIESALSQGFFRDALMDLENLISMVKVGVVYSPALGAMIESLSLLREVIQIKPELELLQLTRRAISQINRPTQTILFKEVLKLYSTAATRTETGLADELFKLYE